MPGNSPDPKHSTPRTPLFKGFDQLRDDLWHYLKGDESADARDRRRRGYGATPAATEKVSNDLPSAPPANTESERGEASAPTGIPVGDSEVSFGESALSQVGAEYQIAALHRLVEENFHTPDGKESLLDKAEQFLRANPPFDGATYRAAEQIPLLVRFGQQLALAQGDEIHTDARIMHHLAQATVLLDAALRRQDVLTTLKDLGDNFSKDFVLYGVDCKNVVQEALSASPQAVRDDARYFVGVVALSTALHKMNPDLKQGIAEDVAISFAADQTLKFLKFSGRREAPEPDPKPSSTPPAPARAAIEPRAEANPRTAEDVTALFLAASSKDIKLQDIAARQIKSAPQAKSDAQDALVKVGLVEAFIRAGVDIAGKEEALGVIAKQLADVSRGALKVSEDQKRATEIGRVVVERFAKEIQSGEVFGIKKAEIDKVMGDAANGALNYDQLTKKLSSLINAEWDKFAPLVASTKAIPDHSLKAERLKGLGPIAAEGRSREVGTEQLARCFIRHSIYLNVKSALDSNNPAASGMDYKQIAENVAKAMGNEARNITRLKEALQSRVLESWKKLDQEKGRSADGLQVEYSREFAEQIYDRYLKGISREHERRHEPRPPQAPPGRSERGGRTPDGPGGR